MSFLQRWFGPPSQAGFAKAMVGELRRQGLKSPVTVDHEKFHLRIGDNEVISLANIYAEFCQVPRSGRRKHLQMLAGIFLHKEEVPTDFAEARPNLRPKIYLRATLEFMRLGRKLGKSPAPEIPAYPLGSHLLSSIVYDLPTSMRSVTAAELEGWGVTYYEALEAAVDNLERSTVAWAKIGDNFWSACSGDNYDSARILLLDRIRSFGITGQPVAMVPQRDEAYVTGDDDPVGLGMMVKLTAATLQEQPRPLSALPLRLVDGEWEDWFPPSDHELFPLFHELRLNFMGALYHDQKALLEELLAKEGRDLFVASYSALQIAGQATAVSYCMWIEGLPSLLPETEHVMLLRQDQKVVASGSFERIRQLVGDLVIEDPEYYPTRYMVDGFPSDEQLKLIGNHRGGS